MKSRLLIAVAVIASSVMLFSSLTTCNSSASRAAGKTGVLQADGVPLPPPPTKPRPTSVLVADGVPLPPPVPTPKPPTVLVADGVPLPPPVPKPKPNTVAPLFELS